MKHVLAFGDSNTYGVIPGSKILERYPESIRWTGILQNEHEDLHIIEDGLCGRTIAFEDATRPLRKGIETLPAILKSCGPLDGVIVMLGTNDCKAIYRASEGEIGAAIEQMADILQEHLPAEKILFISPLHLGENVWLPDKDPEFDQMSIALSRRIKGIMEDIAVRRGIGFMAASDYAKADEADNEHLNEDGHRRLAYAIMEKLKSLKIADF